MPKEERLSRGRKHEREPDEYLRVFRFSGESLAGAAYVEAQDAIYGSFDENDLSVYRFRLNEVWHVAVYGLPPPEELRQQLESILARGKVASLPNRIVTILRDRREEATRMGPWIERHNGPGGRRQV
jgi:hypothetical protein